MATILDNLVGSIVNKVHDVIIDEAIITLGVQEDLKELQRTMNQVQCFLNDAEQRRAEESAVNNWLSELKDAMYKADDIIDLARLEGNKLLVDDGSSSRCSATCIIFQLFTCLPNIQKRHEIAVRIRILNTELEKISKLGERFLKLHNMQPKEEASAVRRMGTCELVEPNLVGNRTLLASTKLVELILRHKDKKTYKIGIVGTGGVGKTTLAQKVYNDEKMKRAFSLRAWVYVSQEYSKNALLKEVLRNFGIDCKEDETIGELSRKFAAAAEKKSLFLVLDDIWQHEVWTNLLRIPLDTAATTIILVTTRNDTTAQVIGVEDVHRVQLMCDHTGWELLWKCMNINEESEVQNLRDIGMDIVGMCGGLPLAIKVIASILATKERTENEWRKFRNRSAWSMNKLPAELRGALYLSYDDLPRHLKQCFLYCALYPEREIMYGVDLIKFWIVEGFVEEQEDQLLEDTAEEYYTELIYRNLLQPDPIFVGEGRCIMHDLLRCLAQHLSQDECFCGDPQSLEAKSLSKLRRISIVADKGSVMLPDMDKEEIRARTLLIHSTKPTIVENTIFKRLPYIRVLDLTSSVIKFIPDCIGSLIHLRSLDLDDTDISYLPESIGCLINLQVLNLQRCNTLHSLPLGITRLCKLRRLGLCETPINQVPKGIGGLKFLNDLQGFPVGHATDTFTQMQEGWTLEEFCSLPQLRRLGIFKLERAGHCSTDSVLINKHHVKALDLQCTEHRDEPYSEEEVRNIETFEHLIPPHTLENLGIIDFFAQSYPTWLGTTHLSSLKYLTLTSCRSIVHLPAIGQLPNLKYLKIFGASAVDKIGPEFVCCGMGNPGAKGAVAFPKLEKLIIVDMPNWEEWTFPVDVEGETATATSKELEVDVATVKQEGDVPTPRMHLLPSLEHLILTGCPKLRALPQQLGQGASRLKTLELRDMGSLKVVENFLFLSETLIIDECEALERVSNIPYVAFLNAVHCRNLRCVEMLDSLQKLFLTNDMSEISNRWLPGLLEQHQKLHRDDLDVYTLPGCSCNASQ